MNCLEKQDIIWFYMSPIRIIQEFMRFLFNSLSFIFALKFNYLRGILDKI